MESEMDRHTNWKLKKVNKCWFLDVGGKLRLMNILNKSTDVHIEDNIIFADDLVYQLTEKSDDDIVITEIKDICQNDQAEKKEIFKKEKEASNSEVSDNEREVVVTLTENNEKNVDSTKDTTKSSSFTELTQIKDTENDDRNLSDSEKEENYELGSENCVPNKDEILTDSEPKENYELGSEQCVPVEDTDEDETLSDSGKENYELGSEQYVLKEDTDYEDEIFTDSEQKENYELGSEQFVDLPKKELPRVSVVISLERNILCISYSDDPLSVSRPSSNSYTIDAADGLCCKLEIPYPTVRRLVQFGELEVSRESVKLLKKLGSGCFGEVYAGKWHNTVDVAVKTLKQSQKTADDFLAEAKLMHHLRHNKLVQLMAVCTKSEPIWIITELMINGTLLDYLRKDIGKTLGFNSLADMAGQIADGMAYLETVNCVHRDLRAANILVGDHIEVKVAGFGLARLIHGSFEDADENTNFPIKWTAPEVAFDRKFSIKSDVWSYGVLLYELITHGCEPYPGMDKFVVLKRVEKGFRMNKPYSCPCPCPDPYYEIMRKCWNLTAINRPTFAFLQDFFNNYNEYAEETHHSIEQTPRRDDIRKLSATSGSSVKALGDNETETRLDLQQSVQMSTPHTYENVQNAVTAKQAQPESNTDNLAITPGFSVEALYSNKAETRLDLQQSVQMSTPHIYENVQNAVTAKQAQPESNTDNFAITPGFSVKALYSYKAEADDEISLYPDDILTDVDPVNKSWWIGIAANGTRGLFPAGHVEIFENVYEEIAKHQRI